MTLVSPSESQSLAHAEVIHSTEAPCLGVADEKPSLASYSLRLLNGRIEQNLPLVAVIGKAIKIRPSGARVEAILNGYSRPITFHSCTSADGVHLTAWKGIPLRGRRVWHQYYYLGQDLEQSCTAPETAP